jgi:hypothetical protein
MQNVRDLRSMSGGAFNRCFPEIVAAPGELLEELMARRVGSSSRLVGGEAASSPVLLGDTGARPVAARRAEREAERDDGAPPPRRAAAGAPDRRPSARKVQR